MDQMRPLAQEPFPFAQRFPNQTQFAVLKISQAAVNDSRGAAGDSRSEIVLLDQQRFLTCAGTLARDGNAVDAAPDDHNVEALRFQRGAGSDR
jgi:hypothetical protein